MCIKKFVGDDRRRSAVVKKAEQYMVRHATDAFAISPAATSLPAHARRQYEEAQLVFTSFRRPRTIACARHLRLPTALVSPVHTPKRLTTMLNISRSPRHAAPMFISTVHAHGVNVRSPTASLPFIQKTRRLSIQNRRQQKYVTPAAKRRHTSIFQMPFSETHIGSPTMSTASRPRCASVTKKPCTVTFTFMPRCHARRYERRRPPRPATRRRHAALMFDHI